MNPTITNILNALGDDATFTAGDGVIDGRIELGDYDIQISGRVLVLSIWEEEQGALRKLETFTDADALISRLIG